jgi:hypothetical protein
MRQAWDLAERSRPVVEPAIKGSIFKGAIDDLARLREEGRISQEETDARLAPEDLAFLEGEINPAAWYPIESYARLMELLGEFEGKGKDAYFIARGRVSARRLMATGFYQQLTFLSRWEKTVTGDGSRHQVVIAEYTRNLRMVVSLASCIYNVGRWAVESDPEHPGRVLIEVREASAYSEPMRLAIEGFLNECARAAREDLDHLHVSERPASDLMRFRMTCDIMATFRG